MAFKMWPLEKYGSQLKCKNKFLVPGNHDPVWKKPNSVQLLDRYLLKAGFTVLKKQHKLELEGLNLVLAHVPGTNLDPRFQEAKPKNDGHTWQLCGHVHTKWKVEGRQINVGVPQWDYYPVSLDQIKEIINAHR